MKRTSPLWLLLLTACPDPSNAHRLWIAPDDSAAMLKLVAEEPEPF